MWRSTGSRARLWTGARAILIGQGGHRYVSKHTHCKPVRRGRLRSGWVSISCIRRNTLPVLLANAQFDWLSDKGRAAGWTPVADGVAAQDLANQGHVVVAVCQNPDPKKPGHIAIVRPGSKTPEQIAAEGPDVVQAGGTNFNSGSLKRGFANHPHAFSKGEIRFYAHALGAAK